MDRKVLTFPPPKTSTVLEGSLKRVGYGERELFQIRSRRKLRRPVRGPHGKMMNHTTTLNCFSGKGGGGERSGTEGNSNAKEEKYSDKTRST